MTREDFQASKSFYVDEITKADQTIKRYQAELAKLQAKCPHPFSKWRGRGGPVPYIRCDDCLGDVENNKGWKVGEHFHAVAKTKSSSDTHDEYKCSCGKMTMVEKD